MKITKKRKNYRKDILDSTKHIRLGSKHKGQYVLKDKIVYIEANGSYTWLHLLNSTKLLSCKSIGYYQELLSQDTFIRIHRSFLINYSYLKLYEPPYRLVYLKGEITLPVSYRKNRMISKVISSSKSDSTFKIAV